MTHKRICALTIIFVAGCHRPGQCADLSPWPSAFESPNPVRQTSAASAIPAVPSSAAAPVQNQFAGVGNMVPGRRCLPLTQEQISRGVIACYTDESPIATSAVKVGFADFGPTLNPSYTSQLAMPPAPMLIPSGGGFYSSCIGGQCSPSYSYLSAGCSTGTCTSGGCTSCGR